MELRNFFWIFLLALLHGSSFLFIKIVVQEIPPFTLVASRTGIAAILLYVILRTQGHRLFKFVGVWKHIAIMAMIQTTLPWVLISWGEVHVDSAIAAILHGTTPLFTIVLAHFFTKDDRLTFMKIIGTFIGFGGLILLIVPSLTGNLQASTLGLIAITLSSVSFAGSIIYVRKSLRSLPHLVVPTATFFLSTLYLLPISILIEDPLNLPIPSFKAISALLALSIIGTALASWVYFHLIKRVSASNLSMTSFLIPLIGTVLGVVILNEKLSWNTYVGGIIIIIGVMIVNKVFKFKK